MGEGNTGRMKFRVTLHTLNMNQPEDIIWNAITDSAKKRFGYDEFQKAFAIIDDDNITENVLSLIIAGHAAGHSAKKIVADIKGHLVLVGFSFPEDALLSFISDRRTDLGVEIKATETAKSLLENGWEIPGILVQVRSMLKK
jgi:hypothetical protein